MSYEKEFDNVLLDLWSLSVILFIMVFGKPPFMNASPKDQFYQMIELGHWTRYWNYFSQFKILSTELKELLT